MPSSELCLLSASVLSADHGSEVQTAPGSKNVTFSVLGKLPARTANGPFQAVGKLRLKKEAADHVSLADCQRFIQGEPTSWAILGDGQDKVDHCFCNASLSSLFYHENKREQGKKETKVTVGLANSSGYFLNLFAFCLKRLFGFPTVWLTFLR